MQILIVDDAVTTRMLTRGFLKELGFSDVYEATDGRDALDRLEALDQLGLALVDWNMPNMNGVDFIRALRASERFDQVQILMMTTETDMSRVFEAVEAGANEYVMKPFSKEMLFDKLNILGVTG